MPVTDTRPSVEELRRLAGLNQPRGLTYYAHWDSPSYVSDLWAATLRQDAAADQRLQQHAREMKVELRSQEQRSRNYTAAAAGTTYTYEKRALTLAPGQGGYSIPPLWVVDQLATAPRPLRVVSDLIGSSPLPRGVASVNVPRLTTGTTTVAPTLPNSVVSDTDIADAAVSSPVVPIAGQEDVPTAMLEQSGLRGAHLDRVVFKDLAADYDAKLETQLIAGVGGFGVTGSILGLIYIPTAATTVTYTSGSPTATGMYPLFGQVFGAVSDTRKVRPEVWIMRGGRYAWMASSEDPQSRPLDLPTAAMGYVQDPTKPNPIAGLIGLPIFTAESIPTNLNATQDAILAFRPSDCLLWESQQVLRVMSEPGSGTLESRIQLRGYAAAILGRYPTSVGLLTGTGLVQPNAQE